jgi:hypothetical protein
MFVVKAVYCGLVKGILRMNYGVCSTYGIAFYSGTKLNYSVLALE